MKQITMPILGVVTVAALLGGFGGGYFFKGYQQTKLRTNFEGGNLQGRGNFVGGNMQRGSATRAFGGGLVTGEVISQDDKTITVKLADGSTKIVLFAESTSYSKTDTGAKTDIKVGSKVGVTGSPNSDGSMTAQNIQLNPVIRILPSPTPEK